jgi:uncharacterized protein
VEEQKSARDPQHPDHGAEAEATAAPQADADTEEQYDQPYTGVLPGTAPPFRPWPGWLRAFLFFTAAMIVSSIGSLVGLALAAVLTGRKIPMGDAATLSQAIFTRPAFVFGSGLFSLLFVVLLTALCVRVWDRRSLTSVGFQLDGAAGRQFAAGLALGALLIGLVFLVEAALGWLHLRSAMPAARWPGYLLLWLLALLPAAAYEEVMLRGYTLQALEQQWGGAAATFLTALLFTALHGVNPNAGWSSFGGILASGVLLGVGYWVTRRLWLPIGLHIGWNLFEGPVLGLPLSGIDFPAAIEPSVRGPVLWTGGPFGPEAGLLGVLVNLVGAALLLLWRKLRPTPGDHPVAPS